MEIKERTIGGRVWIVDTFGGRESLSLFRQLTSLAAGPFSEAAREVNEQLDGNTEIDVSVLLKVLGGVVGLIGRMSEKLDDAQFTALAERLLKCTSCRTEERLVPAAAGMEILFKGDIGTLLQVLAFVVEVNFVGPFASSMGAQVFTAIEKLKTLANLTPVKSSETRPTT